MNGLLMDGNSPNLGNGLIGQTALIVGGGGGIGGEIARHFSRQGANLIVADFKLDAAEEVQRELEAAGSNVSALRMDVTDSSSVGAAVESIRKTSEQIDILVNCAGFTIDRPLPEMTDDDWRAVLDVCLFGTFATCRAVAPFMIDQGYGRIVNLASRAYLGNPGQANYSAAKAGVVGLTKSLAKELGRHGITANAIAPGLVDTDLLRNHPKFEAIEDRAIKNSSIRRLGTVDDVAAAAAYFASPLAGFVTGEVMHVSGGRFS